MIYDDDGENYDDDDVMITNNRIAPCVECKNKNDISMNR
jgi:hypothetical protein